MADFQACYFCGTADGVEEYRVVPDALASTGASGQSVPLCGTCREKLSAILEPVVDAATDAAPTPEERGERSENDPGTEASPEGATAETAGGDPHDSGEPDGSDESTTDDVESDESATDDAESDGTNMGDVGTTSADDASQVDQAAPERPPAYGKVLRLLRNREFPMERRAVETLASSAYDITAPEAEAIVDAAIAEGELIEDGETLRRP